MGEPAAVAGQRRCTAKCYIFQKKKNTCMFKYDHGVHQAAMLALLGALDEAEWADQLPRLAAEAASAGVGRSPAARLAAVRALPTATMRGALLQQHAAAALAAGLLLVRLTLM